MQRIPRIQQAISWWCFVPDRMAPNVLAQTAVELGFEALELVDEEYWPLVRQHGLQIASHKGHDSLTDGLNNRQNHAGIHRELTAMIAKAEQWNIPNLIVFSGNRNGIDEASGAEITAEGLRQPAKIAENAGVNLVIELLNSKVDHPNYQCDHTAWGVKVCQMVDSPRVKLLYDIYHMQIMEGDVIRTIRDYHPYFAHYHTAGNPGRNDLDDTQELNYTAIMRAILQTGYDGYVGQEFIPKSDPIAALKQAFDVCNVSL